MLGSEDKGRNLAKLMEVDITEQCLGQTWGMQESCNRGATALNRGIVSASCDSRDHSRTDERATIGLDFMHFVVGVVSTWSGLSPLTWSMSKQYFDLPRSVFFFPLDSFYSLFHSLWLSGWPLKPSSQSCAVPSPKLRRLQRANGGLAGEARPRELPLQLMRRQRPLAVDCRCGCRTTRMFRPFRDMTWAFHNVSGIWSCWDLPSTSPWVRQASRADSWNAEKGVIECISIILVKSKDECSNWRQAWKALHWLGESWAALVLVLQWALQHMAGPPLNPCRSWALISFVVWRKWTQYQLLDIFVVFRCF